MKYSGHPKVKEFLEIVWDVHQKKNTDYGAKTTEPLSNFKRSENLGIPPLGGVLVRMSDKISRIENIYKNKTTHVKDEALTDTLLDLAGYAAIAYAIIQEHSPESGKDPEGIRVNSTDSEE
jgi:hypothetical protein